MRSTVMTLVAVAIAAAVLVAFRALVFTLYTIPDNSLAPSLVAGDRVVVNRWSYGLRVGGKGLIGYTRWLRQPVERGDFIAFNTPVSAATFAAGGVMMGRVVAVPGDTVRVSGRLYVVPRGCQMCTCTGAAPYVVGAHANAGRLLVPECNIIGRASWVAYNFTQFQFDRNRWFRTIR